MKKALTFKEFMAISQEHYYEGGDGFVECWDEKTFNQYNDLFGIITKSAALKMIKQQYADELSIKSYREHLINGTLY